MTINKLPIALPRPKVRISVYRQISQQSLESREDKWMRVIEFAVILLVDWLDPNAGLAISALRLCFQILKTLRHRRKP